MTVGELITVLQRLPQDAEVSDSVFAGDTYDTALHWLDQNGEWNLIEVTP